MTMASDTRLQLREEDRRALLQAAGQLVRATASGQPAAFADPELNGLAEHPVAGAFVSLKRKGRLRACCGALGEPAPLAGVLRDAAIKTATADPRFPPVSPVEIPHLDLEVWLLHPAEQVEQTGVQRLEAVTVGVHGLQIVRGGSRGLLLPAVPVENGWDAEEFLRQVCLKAGLPATAWKEEDTALYRFEGDRVQGRVVPEGRSESPGPSRELLSARELAVYRQHCRRLLDSLLTGATPYSYCGEASDANVKGVAVTVSQPDADLEWTVSRWSLKQSVPLQSTLVSLCQDLLPALQRRRLGSDDLDIHVAVVHDAAMHGTVAVPDLAGFDPGARCLVVAEGRRTGWIFDAESDSEALLQDAAGLAQVTEPHVAQVFSLACQSTKRRLTMSSAPRPVRGAEVRRPAAAGTFYPADPQEYSRQLDALLGDPVARKGVAAALVPHAGWVYSGPIAADVLRRVEFPRRVVVFSPKHTPHGVEWAVAPHRSWALPDGRIESDPELAGRLVEAVPGLEPDAAAHAREHGIEVELPFIHALAPETRVTGVTIGGGNPARCAQFAEGLASVIESLDEPPLLLISSDMNHFATDAETRRLDEMALQQLDRLDPDALYETVTKNHISMCGMLPAVIALKTLRRLQRLTQSERIGYATTADTTGDPSRVVGYAGMVFE